MVTQVPSPCLFLAFYFSKVARSHYQIKRPSNTHKSGLIIHFLHDIGHVITNLGLKFFLCKMDTPLDDFKER
jgi:hypothetical protein